jgi:hypothetical protein
VAGLGDALATILAAVSVRTLHDLAALSWTELAGEARFEELLEVKAAAERAVAVRVDPDAFSALAGETLADLLAAPTDRLMVDSGRSQEEIEHLKRDLRALLLFLNNAPFRSLHLRDLMPGGA